MPIEVPSLSGLVKSTTIDCINALNTEENCRELVQYVKSLIDECVDPLSCGLYWHWADYQIRFAANLSKVVEGAMRKMAAVVTACCHNELPAKLHRFPRWMAGIGHAAEKISSPRKEVLVKELCSSLQSVAAANVTMPYTQGDAACRACIVHGVLVYYIGSLLPAMCEWINGQPCDESLLEETREVAGARDALNRQILAVQLARRAVKVLTRRATSMLPSEAEVLDSSNNDSNNESEGVLVLWERNDERRRVAKQQTHHEMRSAVPPSKYTLSGHLDRVRGVAITPDSRLAVTVSHDMAARVWQLETGRCERILEGHSRSALGVAITPDGLRVVTTSDDTTVRVWLLATGKCERILEGHSGAVFGVAVTPDGRCAVTVSNDKTARVWQLATGQCERILNGHVRDVNAVAITPDGRRAVTASDDTTARVWQLATGQCERILEGHSSWVLGVAITPDGKLAVTTSRDNTARVWKLATGKCERTLAGHLDGMIGVAITPDGQRGVTTSYDKSARVWHLATGQCERNLEGHSKWVWGVAITPDGQSVVTTSDDTTVRVWQV